ncbi:MAG: hypothetical protein KAW41_06445 [Candidatus Diapherotrites archaeon]|nr:hypothetical protein [Candidatus Diapherotrites archaeon]
MRGQIFVVDLMLALIIVVLAIGLVTQAWDYHLQQTSATVEHAKMQQIAIDAAAIRYYYGSSLGAEYPYDGLGRKKDILTGEFKGGAYDLGYDLSDKPQAGMTCIGSTRGTKGNEVEVFVCRKA